MSDKLNDSDGRVTIAVLSSQLEGMDGKLDTLLADHDVLVRLQVQVRHNTDDINRLGEKLSNRSARGRRESLVEMMVAAVIGASAWLKQ